MHFIEQRVVSDRSKNPGQTLQSCISPQLIIDILQNDKIPSHLNKFLPSHRGNTNKTRCCGSIYLGVVVLDFGIYSSLGNLHAHQFRVDEVRVKVRFEEY